MNERTAQGGSGLRRARDQQARSTTRWPSSLCSSDRSHGRFRRRPQRSALSEGLLLLTLVALSLRRLMYLPVELIQNAFVGLRLCVHLHVRLRLRLHQQFRHPRAASGPSSFPSSSQCSRCARYFLRPMQTLSPIRRCAPKRCLQGPAHVNDQHQLWRHPVVTSAAATVAATGLVPATAPSTLTLRAWQELKTLCEHHRLAGLLAEAVDGNQLLVNAEHMEEAQTMDESWQRHALHVEKLLLTVSASLATAGIDHRLFKGPALAHTVYPNPSLRTFGDLDLIVHGSQLADARHHLVHHFDGTDSLPEVRPGFDSEFTKDVMIRVDGIEVDLHRTLASGPFGLRIPVEELFEDPTSFTLAGTEVLTLPAVPTFLQVCFNAALGDVPPRLMSLRDVAQVQRVFGLTPVDVLPTAKRWGCEAVVAHAVDACWQTLELTPVGLSEWATTFTPGRLDTRLLAASISENRSYTRQLAALTAVRGMGAKARYLRAILTPSKEYLAARGWHRGSHLRRAVRQLRQAQPPRRGDG